MAKLKTVVDKVEDVDEKHRDLYVKRETDGKFVLDADIEDTAGLKGALEKERKRAKELEDKMERVKDVDPEEFKKLKEEHDKLKGKKLWDEGAQEEYFEHRVTPLRKEYQTKEQAWNEERKSLHGELYTLKVKTAVMAAAVKVGAHEHAIPDIERRASEIFKVNKKGEIEAIGADGKPIFNSKSQPLTPEEWMAELPSQAPHLFRGNAGGGNGGGDGHKGERAGALFRSEMTAKEKSAYISKHGQAKYNALPLTRPK